MMILSHNHHPGGFVVVSMLPSINPKVNANEDKIRAALKRPESQYNKSRKATVEEQLPHDGSYLHDQSLSGRERPWHTLKRASLAMGDFYKAVDVRKGFRMQECAEHLTFARTAEGRLRLKEGYFCHIRLCPMCSWRRAIKTEAQLYQIIDFIESRGFEGCTAPAYAFLTLSAGERIPGDQLKGRLDEMAAAWNRLTAGRMWRRYVKGWYRALEITHDTHEIITRAVYERKREWCRQRNLRVGDPNPLYDTYHPHYHVLLVLPGGIRQILSLLLASSDPSRYRLPARRRAVSCWEILWADALGHGVLPESNCKYVRRDGGTNIRAAVCEAGKYTIKATDIVVPDDRALTVRTIRTLDAALHKRRLLAWGGVMAAIRRELALDDPDSDNAEYINIVDKNEDKSLPGEVRYHWHSGYRAYRIATDAGGQW